MPEIEKLHLEDALEDSPQIRSLLGVFEEDINKLRKYAGTLQRCCHRILQAQSELTCATQALSSHLRSYENTKFPLDNDSESILAVTMKQFANTIDEASSWHQIMVTQMTDGMMYPLARFLDFDLQEVVTMCELFQHSSSDVDAALTRFSKLSKKKELEKERLDANEEVYTSRKKFHQIALNYYARLNALQYKRKTALIEPILGYLNALKSHYTLGYESLAISEVDDFLVNINASVQGVHSEFASETQKTAEQIDSIEKQSQHLYHAEPTPNMPYIPANSTLGQKSGYLFQRTKVAGVMNRWDRAFFFTQGGNVMRMGKGEFAGSLAIELDNTITVLSPENEDRRNVFHITNGKKTLVLQALNEREKDEWMCTIQNVIRDGGYVRGKPPPRSLSRSSQSSIDKLPLGLNVTSAVGRENESALRRASGSKDSTPSTPIATALSHTPIVFDMISPTKKEKPFGSSKSGPPLRINPFTQSSSALAADSLRENTIFHEVYTVRFLGSIEVPFDRGDHLIHETMRHILAARAIHNIFKMTESHMMITENKLSLVDPSNQATKAEYLLHDVSFWASHHENNRLVAFITRTNDDQLKFTCHVFESNSLGEEICSTLNTATKIAYQQLIEKEKMEKLRQTEKEILLHNINLQPDISEEDEINSTDRIQPTTGDTNEEIPLESNESGEVQHATASVSPSAETDA